MFRAPRSTVLAALLLTAAAPAGWEQIRYVHDGDTFRLTSGERIRIAGIDAPETDPRQAKCPVEIRRGVAAAAQARVMLAGRSVTLQRVGVSYNRTVATVRLDGRDVAARLVALEAARWWPRGAAKPDWCGTGSGRRERRGDGG